MSMNRSSSKVLEYLWFCSWYISFLQIPVLGRLEICWKHSVHFTCEYSLLYVQQETSAFNKPLRRTSRDTGRKVHTTYKVPGFIFFLLYVYHYTGKCQYVKGKYLIKRSLNRLIKSTQNIQGKISLSAINEVPYVYQGNTLYMCFT